MVSLFKKAAAYTGFDIVEDGDRLRIRFNCAGRAGQRAYYIYPENLATSTMENGIRTVTYSEGSIKTILYHPLGYTAPLHPHDRALMAHALSLLRARREETMLRDVVDKYTQATEDRARTLRRAADLDIVDLPSPPAPRMRHLMNEQPRLYRSHSITGAGKTAEVQFRLIKPYLEFLPRGGQSPVFHKNYDEAQLLAAYKNPDTLNHDDHLMLRAGLLELRAIKRAQGVAVINVRPSPQKPAQDTPAVQEQIAPKLDYYAYMNRHKELQSEKTPTRKNETARTYRTGPDLFY